MAIPKRVRLTFAEGDVYGTPRGMRRIVSMFGGRITYSKGGDRNFSCKPRSLRQWISKQKAVKQ